jgi:TIGR03009 family protein
VDRKVLFASSLGGATVNRTSPLSWGVLLVGLSAGAAWGQALPPAGDPPAERPAPRLLDDRVDVLLREWSSRTTEIKSLYCKFTRTTEDRTWGKKNVEEGSARYLAPNRARLDIETGDRRESHVLTGKGEMWVYDVPRQQITIYRFAQESTDQDQIQNGQLPFLFGISPDKARSRYKFELLKEDPKKVKVRVHPKLAEDQKNFVWCEIDLDKKEFLPERLKFMEPNDSEVTFEFKLMKHNLDINPADFEGRKVAGWNIVIQDRDQPGQAAIPPAGNRR